MMERARSTSAKMDAGNTGYHSEKCNGKYAYKSFYAATERELKKLIKQYNSDRQKYLCEADKTPFWQHAEPIGCVFISFQTYAATQSTAWKQLTRYISNQS